MNRYLIVGAGKLASQVLRKIELLDASVYKNIIGCFDDTKSTNTKVYKEIKVLGKLADILKFDYKKVILVPAIGYNDLPKRLKVLYNLLNRDYNFINLIFSDQIYTDQIGTGNFFSPNSVVDVGCTIGNFNYFDITTTIGEDCEIGDGNYFSNSSVICGDCKICNSNFVGSNATLIDKIKIGSNCKINSSTLIHNNLVDNSHYIEPRKHFLNESI